MAAETVSSNASSLSRTTATTDSPLDELREPTAADRGEAESTQRETAPRGTDYERRASFDSIGQPARAAAARQSESSTQTRSEALVTTRTETERTLEGLVTSREQDLTGLKEDTAKFNKLSYWDKHDPNNRLYTADFTPEKVLKWTPDERAAWLAAHPSGEAKALITRINQRSIDYNGKSGRIEEEKAKLKDLSALATRPAESRTKIDANRAATEKEIKIIEAQRTTESVKIKAGVDKFMALEWSQRKNPNGSSGAKIDVNTVMKWTDEEFTKFITANPRSAELLVEIKQSVTRLKGVDEKLGKATATLREQNTARTVALAAERTATARRGAAGTSYTINRGDTLTKIARDNGTTVEALAKLNNISNVNLILAGAKLILPPK